MARTYRVLADLEPRVLRKLLPLAMEQHYHAGEVIFREGDRSSLLHLIVSGTVALKMNTGEGSLVVQTLHAGDAMGWSALTAECRTHFQATALSNVQTVCFPGDTLRIACEQDPVMGFALMKGLLELVTERLDAARMKLVNANHETETAVKHR
jgi:CRP/FNR family transcriptional regulator, cyclic AMP receptor protein